MIFLAVETIAILSPFLTVIEVIFFFSLVEVMVFMALKTFSLEDGSNLTGEDYKIATYPVKIEEENVYIGFSE